MTSATMLPAPVLWFGNRLRVLAYCTLAILVTSSLPSPAEAQAAIVRVVSAGWDGTFIPGVWNPVTIQVSGDIAPGSRIEIVLTRSALIMGRDPEYEYPITITETPLPSGSGQRIERVVWAQATGATGGRARLMIGGRLVTEERFQLDLAAEVPVVGVVAGSPELALQLRQTELSLVGRRSYANVLGIRTGDLPESWYYYLAFDLLVCDGPSVVALSAGQRSAIRSWIEQGGHVVVAGGSQVDQALSALDGSPITVTPGEVVSVGRIAELLGRARSSSDAVSTIRVSSPRFNQVIGDSTLPIAWTQPLGTGWLSALAFDPLSPTDRGIGQLGMSALIEYVSYQGSAPPGDRNGPQAFRDRAEKLAEALDSVPDGTYPAWPVPVGVVVTFSLFAGPVLFAILAMLRRRLWVWPIIPSISVIGAALIAMTSVFFVRPDGVVYSVSHSRLDGGSGAIQAYAVGVYDPIRPVSVVQLAPNLVPRSVQLERTYFGESVGDGALSSIGPDARYAELPPTARTSIESPGRVSLERDSTAVRTLVGQRRLETGGGVIEADFVFDGRRITGSVTNRTTIPLDHSAVVVGRSYARIGSLAPGQTKTVSVALSDQSDTLRGAAIARRLFEEPGNTVGAGMSRINPLELSHLPDHPRLRRLAALADAVYGSTGLAVGEVSPALTFIGFSDSPVGGPIVSTSGGPEPPTVSLIEQSLQLRLVRGSFFIPPELIRTIAPASAASAPLPYASEYLELAQGPATFAFHPPVPSQARINRISISTQIVDVPNTPAGRPEPFRPGPVSRLPAASGQFQVFDWIELRFVSLPAGREARLDNGDRYRGPFGEILVRIVAQGQEPVRYLPPELSISGEMP